MKYDLAVFGFPLNVRRLLCAISMIFVFSCVAIGIPQDQDLWIPKPRPGTCAGAINVELLELDVSGSMKLLLPELKTQVNGYIDEAPVCTSMIIGTFGETADVRADEFLIDSTARKRLKDAVQSLRATKPYTNLDEVAKAIEWLQFRLQSAYGVDGYTLAVKVLSDQVSAPSGDKPKFSLQKYFQRHLAGSRLKVVEVEVAPSGTRFTRAPTGANEISLRVPVDQPLSILAQKPTPEAVVVSTNRVSKDQVVNSTAGSEMERRISRQPLLVLCGFLAFFAAMGLVLLAVRRESPTSAGPADSPTAQPEVPVALLVQEIERAEEGDRSSRDTVLGERVRVPVLLNVPVRFGTDANVSNYVVTPGEGITKDEIFCLTLTHGPLFFLRALKGTTYAGKPIAPEGLRLSARDPIAITHGRRQWRITPSFISRSHDAGEVLFAARESTAERSAI